LAPEVLDLAGSSSLPEETFPGQTYAHSKGLSAGSEIFLADRAGDPRAPAAVSVRFMELVAFPAAS
jgi:hypothetical protein